MITTPAGATGFRLGAVFSEMARAHAAAPAIVCATDGRTVTYCELLSRAQALADVLFACDISADDVVMIPGRRHLKTVVAMLGVALAGAAYLPTPNPLSVSRRAIRSASVRPCAVITDTRRTTTNVAWVELDDRGAVRRAGPSQSRRSPRDQDLPSDLGYVMFTSGTTGAAKAVAVAGSAIINLVRGQDYARFGPAERTVWSSPSTFDASTFEVWSALLNGGSLLIAEDAPLTAVELRSFIQDRGATTVWLSAGLFDVMATADIEAFRGIGQVLTGGDVVSATAARRFAATHPDSSLIIGYGPTETTTFATAGQVRPADINDESLTIGHPLAGVTVEIRDGNDTAVAPGTIGEIVIGGRGVAHGYLGVPEGRGGRFFVGADGQRRFRSGDYGLIRPDGRIEFHGRRDRQVKIRGYRIYLDHVERVLGKIPEVRQAAVVTDGDSAAERRIAAFVVPRLDEPSSRARIRDELAARLPASHLPTVWRWIPALPLTAPGKFDRSALSAQLSVQARDPTRNHGTAKPVSGPAPTVASSLWAHWLRCSPPTDDADFFACGGDSLRAIGLLGDLEVHTGITLPMSVLYQGRTFGALIEALSRPRATLWSAAVPLRAALDASEQRAIYFVHGLSGDVFGFHEVAENLRFPGAVWGLRGLSDTAGAPQSIAGIAEFYADVVETLTPTGTACLIGYSAGGIVAVSMAALLEARRRRPGLIMLDVSPPEQWLASGEPHPDRVEPAAVEAVALANAGGYGVRRVQFMERLHVALAASSPVVTSAPAALLHSDEPRTQERGLQWRRWLTDVRIILALTGDHHTILRVPQAAQTAAAIDDCIAATTTRPTIGD